MGTPDEIHLMQSLANSCNLLHEAKPMTAAKKKAGRKQWGTARQTFMAIQNVVMARINTGEPATEIYADLAPEMSYRSFALHIRKVRFDPPRQMSPVRKDDSNRDGKGHKVIQSESPPSEAVDPITAAIRAKAAPGTFERLKRKPAYNPRENTIEELFGVDEHGNPVGDQ